jgi:hypothetical protein
VPLAPSSLAVLVLGLASSPAPPRANLIGIEDVQQSPNNR